MEQNLQRLRPVASPEQCVPSPTTEQLLAKISSFAIDASHAQMDEHFRQSLHEPEN